MGAVYKSICYEADVLALLATRLSERQIELKVEIEKLMNDGFVNIAKARYIMGSTCVTKMQLPTGDSNPIKAVATVLRNEEENGSVFYITRDKGYSLHSLSEVSGEVLETQSEGSVYNCTTAPPNNTCVSSVGKSQAAFKQLLQNDPKALKKSKTAFLVQDESYQEYNEELLDEISNSDSNESLSSVTDPIRLFGILVPNVLKKAQVTFNEAVDLLGECATVQLQLGETLEKLSHLKKVLSLIEEASKETKVDILTPKVYWTPSESSTVSCYTFKPEGEEEELSEISGISIQKSIRSVFYSQKDIESQERESRGETELQEGESRWESESQGESKGESELQEGESREESESKGGESRGKSESQERGSKEMSSSRNSEVEMNDN